MEEGKHVKNPGLPVLYVDDDPITHKFVQAYLSDWDMRSAMSGAEALEMLDKENIQIVITDIKMPGMDGIQLLREIKRVHGTVQVIMATSTSEIDHLIAALQAGANDFLTKPLSREDLEEALTNSLKKINRWKRAMRELFKRGQETD